MHKSVPVESKNKGVYYLNSKSLENFQKRIGAEPLKDIHKQKDVEAWLQQVKDKSAKEEVRSSEPSIQTQEPRENQVKVKNSDQPVSRSEISLADNFRRIDKTLDEYDQFKLNNELDSIYVNDDISDPLSIINSLAENYLENKQFVKLDMMVIALGYIQSKDQKFNKENPKVNDLINAYKGTYTKEQAKPTTTANALNKILSEPVDALNERSLEKCIKKIKNGFEVNSIFYLDIGFREYILDTNNITPLIDLLKFFTIHNETLKANAMIEAFKNILNSPMFAEYHGAINEYLLTAGHLTKVEPQPAKENSQNDEKITTSTTTQSLTKKTETNQQLEKKIANPDIIEEILEKNIKSKNEPKQILMQISLKPEIYDILETNVENLLKDIDDSSLHENILEFDIDAYLNVSKDVDPLIGLHKHYLNTNQNEKKERLETAIKSNLKNMNEDHKKKVTDALNSNQNIS